MGAAFNGFVATLEAADCRQGRSWLCPAHDDRNASLSVSEGDDGKVLVKCHAGCTVEDIVGALGLEMRELFDHQGEGGLRGSTNPTTVQRRGCTVEQYVGRLLWRKGSKLCLYGLWRQGELPGCTVGGGGGTSPTPQVVLVEGESDCHTLWHHGIPALGLPGAGNWREQRDAGHLEDFGQIFVVIEPDKGGETVLGWLGDSRIRDRAWLVQLDEYKDPSGLHLADPEKFAERWRAAIEAAEPWRERASRIATAERRDVWAKCESLAQAPRILDLLATDAARAGVTGEERTVKVAYLILTSRLLERLASIVVKGQSSSGKSWVTQQTSRFFPESAYYEMTAASEHALIYDDEPLSHRILVVYEASGLESDKFSYIVRSLLSEGRLRYPTVVKKDGELKTVIIEREGPTGLITTTTALRLHHENETRLISLASDESPEQTADVLGALAEEDGEEIEYEPWHSLQRWLELGDCRVTIPYGMQLAKLVPPVAVRLRRDFGSVLAVVRAHALLHQATRERDARGRVEATLEDYAIVRELLADVVSEGVGKTVSPEVREIVEKVRELVEADLDDDAAVTQRQLINALQLDKGSVSRRVRAALGGGYLVNREDRRGKPHRLVPGDPLPDDVEILPSPERLAEACTPGPRSQSPEHHDGSAKPETALFETSQEPQCDGYTKRRKPHQQAVATGVTANQGGTAGAPDGALTRDEKFRLAVRFVRRANAAAARRPALFDDEDWCAIDREFEAALNTGDRTRALAAIKAVDPDDRAHASGEMTNESPSDRRRSYE